ncbi:MAG: sulfatase-like hydrolase/transferase, partial [Campylobacterales bacterium]|nr:sulfatase-like hydrolase/transferase [Campylobacterales bacterium]
IAFFFNPLFTSYQQRGGTGQVGNSEFAGMSDLLTAYGIKVVSQNNCLGEYPKAHCGFNDFDLFQEAKKQIKEFEKTKDKPFALFMSTINTHFPNGIYDKRMEQFISASEDNLEFSVSAVDYLVGDFIKFLKDENLLDSTAIFIFPDHLLMGSSGPVIEKLKKNYRQSYLITNVDEKKLPKKMSETLYHIDLPRIIVDGAEIKTNAKFLRDFINTNDYAEFLNTNKVKLTTLNEASVRKRSFKDGVIVSVIGNNLTIKSDEDSIVFAIDSKQKNETFDVTFNNEMVSIGYGKSNLINAFTPNDFDKKHKRLHLIIDIKDGNISKTYFGNKQMLGIYKQGTIVNYVKEDVDLIRESNNAILEKPERVIQKYELATNIIAVTSSEFITSKSINSEIRTNGESFNLSRGLNLLYKNDDGSFNVDRFDTYGSIEAAKRFTSKVSALIKNKNFWAIASHDAIRNDYPNFKEALNDLNFKILQNLNGRVAYIAYVDSDYNIKEFSADTSLSYYIPSFSKKLTNKEIKLLNIKKAKNNSEANIYGKNTKRFIAHAGGMIDGHKYTNSLEALNFNYKKGFRLFELDIIKTSDDIYVSSHDWKHWAKTTGYKGELPPTKKTFLEHKIYQKYTPMEIADINKWFKDHPDAILVTDKVNTPADFSSKFVDKKRLMMELFTWEAVNEGINAKIKSAMPTGGILNKIKGDKITYLKQLGITDIAAGRGIVDSQKELVEKIVTSGINIFAFHINFSKGKDEKYVVCSERNYFYGMYADIWNFNSVVDCAQ